MLVAAFLLGYFFQEMMKGCQVMEGLTTGEGMDKKLEADGKKLEEDGDMNYLGGGER